MDRALGELVRVLRPSGRLVVMVYHRRSLFYGVLQGAPARPAARSKDRAALRGRRARATSTASIVRHFSRRELRAKLESVGLASVSVQPYGQDSELLPLPRTIRVPITDRLPRRMRDAVLDRFGHQLAATAAKPA